MEERLKKIAEEFIYLNEEKRKIEIKPEKTIEDLENLKAIEELYKYMREKINNWGAEKNSISSSITYEQEEIKEKSLREQFEENRDKIDVIRNKSKSMQPPFEGIDKKRKDEILEQLGFVKTTNVDGREVRIHPSLVGTYYDLVKEQRKLTEELNKEYYKNRDGIKTNADSKTQLKEETEIIKEAIPTDNTNNIGIQENVQQKNIETVATKEQELLKKKQELEMKRDSIINGTGRKETVKYKNQEYYIPRNKSGYLTVLLHEIEKIESELNKLKFDKEENQVEKVATDSLKEIKSQEVTDLSNEKKAMNLVIEGATEKAINPVLGLESKEQKEENQVEKIVTDFLGEKQKEENQMEKVVTDFLEEKQPTKEESIILESNGNENDLNDSFKANIINKIEKANSDQVKEEQISTDKSVIPTPANYETKTETVEEIFENILNPEKMKVNEEQNNQELEEISEIFEKFTSDYIGKESQEKNSNANYQNENKEVNEEENLKEYDSKESSEKEGYRPRIFKKTNEKTPTDEYGYDEFDEEELEDYEDFDFEEITEEEFEYAYNNSREFDNSPIDSTITKEKNREKRTLTGLINKVSEKFHNKFDLGEEEFEDEFEDEFEEEFEEEFEDEFEDEFEEEFEEEKRSNKILSGFVTNVKKASSKISKKAKISAALIATSLIILVTSMINIKKNDDVPDVPNFTTTEEQIEEENKETLTEYMDYGLVEDEKIEEDKETLTEYMDYGTVKEENFLEIGKTVKINEGSRIYRNGYDAYLNESAFNPYYNFDDNRVILGTGILINDKIEYVFACDENANQTINNLINEGGKVVSILTANKDKYLSDYDGNDILTEDEINAYAEGWYNVEGINLNNMKGKSM